MLWWLINSLSVNILLKTAHYPYSNGDDTSKTQNMVKTRYIARIQCDAVMLSNITVRFIIFTDFHQFCARQALPQLYALAHYQK